LVASFRNFLLIDDGPTVQNISILLILLKFIIYYLAFL